MAKQKYTFIDLFAGCGGLSLGMEQAGVTRQSVIVDSKVRHENGKASSDDAKNWWKINRKKYGARWGKAVMELLCTRNEELSRAFVGKVVRRCEEIVR